MIFSALLFLWGQMFPFPGPGREPAAPSTISYVAGTANFSVSNPVQTIVALNVRGGDKIIGFCKSGGATSTVFTATSTGGDSPSYLNIDFNSSYGSTQMWYIANANANSADTFQCSNSTGNGYVDIVVMQFRGGLGVLDTQLQGVISYTDPVTTGPFSTAINMEVIVMCAASWNNSSYSAGLIGGATAILGPTYTSSGDCAACEYLITSAAQSGITASLDIGSTSQLANWGLGVFK